MHLKSLHNCDTNVYEQGVLRLALGELQRSLIKIGENAVARNIRDNGVIGIVYLNALESKRLPKLLLKHHRVYENALMLLHDNMRAFSMWKHYRGVPYKNIIV